jgi:hypothetical protein
MTTAWVRTRWSAGPQLLLLSLIVGASDPSVMAPPRHLDQASVAPALHGVGTTGTIPAGGQEPSFVPSVERGLVMGDS